MLRNFALRICFFVCLIFCGHLHAEQTCKVGGAPRWYPVFYYEQEQAVGVMVDIFREVGKQASIDFQFHYLQPWSWSLHQLETGQLDILAGVFYTDERSEKYAYSDAVLTEHIHIFTRKSRQLSITSLADLSDFHGLRPLGGSYGQTFDAYAQQYLKLKGVSPKSTMLKMLLHDRADYLVLLERDGMEEVIKPEFAEKVKMHENPQIPIDVFIAFSKNSPCLSYLASINQHLEKMSRNGTLAGFEAKYQLPQ